jgi:hypothetical protein
MANRTYMRIVRNCPWEGKKGLSRRRFLAATGAAAVVRVAPTVARPGGRRILTLVYDKALGMMRAVERVVP